MYISLEPKLEHTITISQIETQGGGRSACELIKLTKIEVNTFNYYNTCIIASCTLLVTVTFVDAFDNNDGRDKINECFVHQK